MIENLHSGRAPVWVSVICICYNHRGYVRQALESVFTQTYPYIELIVIDNGSTDGSDEQIRSYLEQFPTVQFLRNLNNLRLTRAFNQGLALSRGMYIIDLSADDVLMPDRIARQVAVFETLPDSYGVVFSNAAFIDAAGTRMGTHFPVDRRGQTTVQVPTGDVFKAVLSRYFICTPTMLIRRTVLDRLGGYDDALSYEDFDFWVRSSRFCSYAYLDAVLTLKRQVADSLSTQILQRDNQLIVSTWLVCRKAFDLCQTRDEFEALADRLKISIRKAFYTEQFDLVHQFGWLLKQIRQPDILTRCILVISHSRPPVNYLYRLYRRYWRNPFRSFMVRGV